MKAIFKPFNAFYCLYGANVRFKQFERLEARKLAFLGVFYIVGLHADRIKQIFRRKKEPKLSIFPVIN